MRGELPKHTISIALARKDDQKGVVPRRCLPEHDDLYDTANADCPKSSQINSLCQHRFQRATRLCHWPLNNRGTAHPKAPNLSILNVSPPAGLKHARRRHRQQELSEAVSTSSLPQALGPRITALASATDACGGACCREVRSVKPDRLR